MKKIAENLLTNAPRISLLILAIILVFPAFSTAAGPDPSSVGQAQKIQDPQKLQRALYTLLHKAQAQNKIINDWHRKALSKAAQAKAKNSKLSSKATAEDASRKSSGYATAMVEPD